MPPKQAKGSQASKKTQEKKKEKVIEDKTFGLKNKKGKKQQEFIKHVTQQVKYGNQSMTKVMQVEMMSKKEKEELKKEKSEMTALFRPVAATQKASLGADPKSILCAFFKQGLCKKGDKCKFSHDLSLEAKSEKRSMYVDVRDQGDPEGDTMESWDEEQLRSVVDKKHGKEGQLKPKTDKVCKHFLYAIEKGVYGWFWECPNGGDKCIYRHALPSGFVLKRDKEEVQVEETATITLEELVEREREELIRSGKKLTPVTLQSFLQWKKRKLKEKKAKAEVAKGQRRDAFKQGKLLGISGRELFEFNPDAVRDDDEAAEGTSGLAATEVDSSDSESGEELMQDLTNMAFELTVEDDGGSGNEVDGVEVDEELFLAEALDPLNRALLARLAAGDLMLDREEEEEEEEECGEGENVQ